MALERKRSHPMDHPTDSPTSSTSGRARAAASSRAPVYAQYRTDSPPASAYFSHFDGDHHHDPLPSRPDTDAHFAYSTTLRRHTLEGPLGLPPAQAGQSISSLGELRTVVETEGAKGVWDRTVGRVIAAFTQREQYERLPTHREEGQKESASARFAHSSVQVRYYRWLSSLAECPDCTKDTLAYFSTSSKDGLSSRRVPDLLATHGYNEFTVSTPEPVLIKFAKTIYENPLILLLCGSAIVSAVMGNIDDAVSITVAVLIVLTGELPPLVRGALSK